MTKRLFVKFFLLIALVVGISTAAMELLMRRSWEATPQSITPLNLRHNLQTGLLEALGISLLAGFVIALIGAECVARRLRRMVAFAQEIAEGKLSAHLPESGSDEIAGLAITLDKTARRLELNFRNLESSRQQLETLLNSMEDAVVAVSPKREVVWFNWRNETAGSQFYFGWDSANKGSPRSRLSACCRRCSGATESAERHAFLYRSRPHFRHDFCAVA